MAFLPPPTYSNPLLTGGGWGSPVPLAGIGHNSLLGGLSAPPTISQWAYVRQRFQRLLSNLNLTEDQIADGQTKIKGVASTLSRTYWKTSDGLTNTVLIGSWAKQTQVRPPRDIDCHFVLPIDVYYRFEQRQGNKQSQLLQEVRAVLAATYPLTDISGDRHVVVIPFSTYQVEVAPAFHRQGGGYLICDTTGTGRYKHVDPAAEVAALSSEDSRYNGNVRKLTRLLKQWQRACSVPIKSFHIEAAVKGSLAKVSYAGCEEFWFDWLVRDTFAHLINCKNGTFSMSGTSECIGVGEAWVSRAESAYARAVKACEFERANEDYLAGAEWQKIFGTEIPIIAW
jgi:hypothetical protein